MMTSILHKGSSSIERRTLGAQGEELIASTLEKERFIIYAKNYKTRQGEIDIVAQKKELLIFVEVKLRRSQYFNLSEVVGYQKQKKIIKTAAHYIHKHTIRGLTYRFDVALLENISGSYTVTYIKNAFTAPETGGLFLF